jgi:heavy metal translocating P-type ATPase
MTFMIVASPCAVVLATMPPLLSTIANAGRHGLLVKSAVALEKFGGTSLVAFDKTGTLTEGTPRVSEIEPARDSALTEEQLLALAAAVERPSEHPVARAIVSAAHERGIVVPHAEEFTSTPGRGVTGVVDGRAVSVGSPALLAGREDDSAPVAAVVAELEEDGRTVVVVLVDGTPVGVLALADRVRAGARDAVARLTRMTGRTPILLTGDNERAARRLAQEVGITDVRAGLLPDDKVTEVRALQAEGHRVLLVGDGVNDAPAMAAAELGVAMGRHGSDLALETADAVVVRDDLATLPKVIGLSRRAHGVVKANLTFAAAVITVLVTWDVVWLLPLPLGVAGHEGSTMVVALNGLRLLRKVAWQRADAVSD